MNEVQIDTVCQVLASEQTDQIVFSALDYFIPNRIELSPEYASHPNGKPFANELEMVRYFADHKNLSQTFYWSESAPSLDKLTIGAEFTSDGRLIITITLNGTEAVADKYLLKLKSFLDSECGFISFGAPGNYVTAEDFANLNAEVNVS